jgi:uncharacterized protein YcnI
MKLSHAAKSIVLGLALVLATSAFAGNKGSLKVQEPITVSGQQVPAGDYKVSWEGTGSNVEVSILQGSKVVAKTSGRIVEMNQSSQYDSAVVRKNSDGSRALSEIRFSGKKQALAIGEAAAKMDAQESSTK